MPDPSQYTLSTRDVARRLGVNVDTVQRWTDSGKFPCVRTPSNFRRFRPEDIDTFAATMLPNEASA